MFKNHLVLIIFLISIQYSFAQNNYWTPIQEASLRINFEDRDIKPSIYSLFYLDIDQFSSIIKNEKEGFLLDLPIANDRFVTFSMRLTPVFAPQLAAKYPDYYSLTGNEINGPAHLKLSLSPFGVHGMIFLEDGQTIFIDPVLRDNAEYYQVYDKSDFVKRSGNFSCGLHSIGGDWDEFVPDRSRGSRLSGDCQFRQYRLALACTGEYAAFHGGTVDRVLSAYNNTMTRINGVYEKEIGVTMQLVADTDKLIFLNASSDPYSNTNGEAMLGQNQSTVDNIIGFNNYDIGHVFSTAGGGIASLRSVCTSRKAQGVTGQRRPVGDPFDIDYVAHEIGHQFGANHTQNNSCQRNLNTAMEPGSASTIMGYAGICSPNVQNASDDYFHAVSLQEMFNFIVAGQGGSCAQIISTDNVPPQVNLIQNIYKIPRSTPFVLTAEATDEDGDQLTYCWEQFDNQVANMPPLSTSIGGPNFRTFKPSSSPSRFFPALGARNPTWEVLPSVEREMNFRCTVRDNNSIYGCTDEVNVAVDVVASAGPFRVTEPNIQGLSWQVGSSQTVVWNVANTDQAPINCNEVDIFLSTDGGSSFPHLVASRVPNSGTALLNVPNLATNAGRIMVKASDNIFFNVTSLNFRIVTSFSISLANEEFAICDDKDLDVEINLQEQTNFTGPLNLSIREKPSPISAILSPERVDNLPFNVILELRQLDNLTFGSHTVQLQANANQESQVVDINLFKYKGEAENVTLISPENNTLNLATENIYLRWLPLSGVKNYRVMVSKNSNFNDWVYNQVTALNELSLNLEEATLYYWRVEALSPCFANAWSETYIFTTQGFAEGDPILLSQNPLIVFRNDRALLSNKEIDIAGDNPALIRMTLLNIPRRGTLLNAEAPLFSGQTFTLEDVKTGKMAYIHDGGSQEEDSFSVTVLDDKNRLIPELKMDINVIQSSFGFFIQKQNVTCEGEASGSINVVAFNGEIPYTYSTDGVNFVPQSLFTNLEAGNYIIYVRDALGETSQKEVIITEPLPLELEINQLYYDFELRGLGGTGDLVYSIDGLNFSTSNILNNLENGNYLVLVKDYFGCVSEKALEVAIPQLKLNYEVLKDVDCAGQKALIKLNAEGGFPPYVYSADGTTFGVVDTLEVDTGFYNFVIVDKGGKVVLSKDWISNQPKLIVIDPVRQAYTYILNASGGSGGLIYSLDNLTFVKSDTIIFPSNGQYTVYVRDSLGCQRNFNIRVNVLSRASLVQRDVKCFGGRDGFLSISPIDGQFPFEYKLNEEDYFPQNRWSNLAANTYRYTVRDNTGDTLSGLIEIGQPDSLYFTLSVAGSNNILVEAFGGIPPYRYSLNGGDSFLDINQFSDLDSGEYDIVVRDENGCLTQIVNFSTSLNEDSFETVRLFPNPVSHTLRLYGTHTLTVDRLIITDILGQLRKTVNIKEGHDDFYEIDVSELSAGLYVLRLETTQGQKVFKWIKI